MTTPYLAELLSSVRGVVFDKDGTLIDLDARWVPVFTMLVDRLAGSCDDPSLVRGLSELLGIDGGRLVPDGPAAVDTAEQIIDRVIARLVERGHESSDAEKRVVKVAADAVSAFGPVQPLGDVAASLLALRASGLRVGVATSDDRANTVSELTDLGVVDLVDTMRCADDGGPVKPDPAVLSSIATEWSVAASELVFVGDSLNDMATARAAGCSFVARCDPDRVPDWADAADAVVASIDELVVR